MNPPSFQEFLKRQTGTSGSLTVPSIPNPGPCPVGQEMLEDGRCYPIGTYGPADPGAVALLPGIFGGGGDSTFVPQDQSGLPPGYAGPGSISVISPAPPLIGQRPGDVVDQDNNGTIDYLAPPSRWR